MARKVHTVAPACYPISYYPRKRALRITTSSDGGAGSSTGNCSGTMDSGASSSCCRLELAACHVWYSVRCPALFRSPPPFFSFHVYLYLRQFIICNLPLFYSFFNIYIYIFFVYICLFIPHLFCSVTPS
jgi:hypothetical protein